MEKKRFKKFLKCGVFLFGISLLLWNCEKEENFNLNQQTAFNQEKKITSFSLKELENDFVFKETSSVFGLAPKLEESKDIKSRDLKHKGKAPFTIDVKSIKKISKENYTSYTFSIQRNSNPRNIIENLVIEKKNDTIRGYFMKYKLDATYLEKVYKGEPAIFNAAIKRTPYQDNITELLALINNTTKTNLHSKERICFYQTTSVIVRCKSGKHEPGQTCDYAGTSNAARYEVYSNLVCYGVSGTGRGGDPWDGDDGYNPIDNNTGGGGGNDTGNGSESTPNIPCNDIIHRCDKNTTDDEEGCPSGQTYNVVTGKCEKIDDCNTTKEDLKKVFPNTDISKLKEITDAINKHGKDFGIDTKEKLQHFLAQAGHESDNFKTFSEYTNFQVKRLHITFKEHFNPYSNPTKDKKKQNPKDYEISKGSKYAKAKELYNYVYNDKNREKGYKIGNINAGDGYKYRGRGIFQLSGKYNYKEFNDFYQKKYGKTKNLITNPELVATDKEIAIISALWFYNTKINITIDSKTTVESITKLVNGGDNGLIDRKNKFKKAKTNINCK